MQIDWNIVFYSVLALWPSSVIVAAIMYARAVSSFDDFDYPETDDDIRRRNNETAMILTTAAVIACI